MGVTHQKLAQPPKPPKYAASFDGLFWIDGGYHRIPAKLHEYKDPSGEGPYWTVIYCPTHDEDLGAASSKLNVYKEVFKVDILSFDYCGFGLHQCSTKTTESVFYDTLQSVFNWLHISRGVPTSRVVFYGKGLGTGPILDFASQFFVKTKPKKRSSPSHFEPIPESPRELGAMVLQSPMLSLNSIEPENFEGESVPRHDAFLNSKKLVGLEIPTLLAHGTEDRFIPFRNYQKFKKITSRRNNVQYKEIQGKGHHGLDYDDDFLEAVADFLASLAPGYVPPEPASTPSSPNFKKPETYLTPEELLKSQWLADLGLEHLATNFILGGYVDLESMNELTPEILEGIGITSRDDQSKLLDDLFWRKFVFPLGRFIISWGCIVSKEAIIKGAHHDYYRALVKVADQIHEVSCVKMNHYIDRAAFCSEIQILSTLSDPNVLCPLYFCIEANRLALVFPWKYLTLQEFVSSHKKKICDSFLFKVWSGLVRGVKYLHSRTPPIYHGHLSVSNVYVNGVDDCAIIGGWAGRMCRHTTSSPPEVSAALYNEKGDIYCLGWVAMELALMDKKGPDRVTRSVKSLYYDDYKLESRFGAKLQHIIKLCLCADPKKRVNISELDALVEKAAVLFVPEDNFDTLREEVTAKLLKRQKEAFQNLYALDVEASPTVADRRKTVNSFGSPPKKKHHVKQLSLHSARESQSISEDEPKSGGATHHLSSPDLLGGLKTFRRQKSASFADQDKHDKK